MTNEMTVTDVSEGSVEVTESVNKVTQEVGMTDTNKAVVGAVETVAVEGGAVVKKMRKGEIRCTACGNVFGITIRRLKNLSKKAKGESKLRETYQCRSCRPHLSAEEKKIRAKASAAKSAARRKAMARKEKAAARKALKEAQANQTPVAVEAQAAQ